MDAVTSPSKCAQCQQLGKDVCNCPSETQVGLQELPHSSNLDFDPSLSSSVIPPESPREQNINTISTIFAGIVSAGSGVTTAGAFAACVTSGMIVIAPIPAAIIAGLLFVGGFFMNWYLNRNSVPAVLKQMFGQDKLFQGLMQDEDGNPLDTKRRWAMRLGVFLALGAGFTNGVLAYVGMYALFAAFPILAFAAPVMPIIAALMGGVTTICLSCQMLKKIAKLVRIQDHKKAFMQYMNDFINPEHHKDKSIGRIRAEQIVTILLALVAFPLAAIGLYATMNAGAVKIKALLLEKIPGASVVAVEVSAKAIAFGLAFVARIPFHISNMYDLITSCFSPSSDDENPDEEAGCCTTAKVQFVMKAVLMYGILDTTNAAGHAFLPLVAHGGDHVLDLQTMADAGGGFANSYATGAANIDLKAPLMGAPLSTASTRASTPPVTQSGQGFYHHPLLQPQDQAFAPGPLAHTMV